MKGLFITFEGTEGSGKTTQISLLAERLRSMGHSVRTLREPGGTPIGEEIRHTLKHSPANHAMTAEAELLLMNASRAQLVREVIRPALAAGEIVLCDRFYDSTTAYQGYGRQLDLQMVKHIIDVAVGRHAAGFDVALYRPARSQRSPAPGPPADPAPALQAGPDGGSGPRVSSSAWPKATRPSPPPNRSACGNSTRRAKWPDQSSIWGLVQPLVKTEAAEPLPRALRGRHRFACSTAPG